MVVLDALHYIQGHLAPDLAVRWNCKAGKCGSCSAEVNGRPRLTCKTRMDDLPKDQPITVMPMKSFPRIKDLVTDVSWNYSVNKKIPAFRPNPNTDWKISQLDVDRVQEFRKCIECFLCQDVCHVLREHDAKENIRRPALFRPRRRPRNASARRASIAPPCSRTISASASATSPNVAPKSAPKKFISRTTPSFRSRSVSSTSSTIR